MNHPKLTILIFSLCFALPPAPVVPAPADTPAGITWRVQGNRHFSTGDIRRMIAGAPDSVRSVQSLTAAMHTQVLPVYRKSGYLAAGVDSVITRPDGTIIVIVTEGPRAIFHSVAVTGVAPERRDAVHRLLELAPGDHYEESRIERQLRQILEWYDNHGYPYGQAAVDEGSYDLLVESGGRSMNLTIAVTEGDAVSIDSVVVRGNTFTKPGIILRESGLYGMSIYSRERLDIAEQKLQRLAYVDPTSPPTVVRKPNGSHMLMIGVEEQPAHHFSGILGYVPSRQQGSGGYLTGEVELQFGNLFGTGRELEAAWHSRDETSQDLLVRFREPWLMGWPVHVRAEYSQTIQDSSYLSRTMETGATWPVSTWLDLQVRAGRETTSPDSFGVSEYAIPASSSLFGEIGMTYDNMANPVNPERGWYYYSGYRFGRRKNTSDPASGSVPLPQTTRDDLLTLDIRGAIPLRRGSVLWMRGAGQRLQTGRGAVPYSHLLRLGGARTLRGYREDQFRGATIGWCNLEYRYLLGRYSRIFLFFDAGVIVNAGETLKRNGFGGGIRLKSQLGIIGLDYGLAQGDNPADGKIHFGLENTF